MGFFVKFESEIDQLKELEESFEYKTVIHHNKDSSQFLARLCDKYGSDKGWIDYPHRQGMIMHTFTDYYSKLFDHCRNKVKKVFECGLGTNNTKIDSNMGEEGKPGASLRVWREYFPKAKIYGADIDRNILFTEDRIYTYYMDQTKPNTIKTYWGWMGDPVDFDFMIDDGLHTVEAGICLFTNSIDHLAQDGVYVIEDVGTTGLLQYRDFFADKNYNVEFVTIWRPYSTIGDNNLVVIRKK